MMVNYFFGICKIENVIVDEEVFGFVLWVFEGFVCDVLFFLD